MRRTLLALLVAVTLGCVHEREASRHVYVPKRSAECWRECNSIAATCRSGDQVANAVASLSRYGNAGHASCERDREQCLLSCPGAYWVYDSEEE